MHCNAYGRVSRSPTGGVSRHRRVSADAMGSGNEGIGPRTPSHPSHIRLDGDGGGERDPKKNGRSPPWSGRHIHTLRARSALDDVTARGNDRRNGVPESVGPNVPLTDVSTTKFIAHARPTPDFYFSSKQGRGTRVVTQPYIFGEYGGRMVVLGRARPLYGILGR